MATPVFGTLAIPSALSLGKHMLTINNPSGRPEDAYKLAVNSLEYTYSRVITPYYTLNTDEIGRLLVSSDPLGTLRLSYIMGASKNLENFIKTFSDECNIAANSISANIGLSECANLTDDQKGQKDNEKFVFGGCLINGISGNLSRSERGTLCIGRIDITFVNLSIDK